MVVVLSVVSLPLVPGFIRLNAALWGVYGFGGIVCCVLQKSYELPASIFLELNGPQRATLNAAALQCQFCTASTLARTTLFPKFASHLELLNH